MDTGRLRRLSLRGVNAYLVRGEDGPTLIDAGTPLDAGRVVAGLDRAGIDLADVRRVLVTHYDVDHVGGLAGLRRRGLDAPVHAADPDASHVEGRSRPPLTRHKGLFQNLVAPVVRPVSGVERVTDGDRIGGFDAHRTPGHTPGHVAYVHRETGAALVGDLVLERRGGVRLPPWPLNDDTGRARESVRDLLDRAGPFEALCPGHGEPLRTGGRTALERLAGG
jgi:glyoxylase-like metal-dependent hydrolase (beta-lactamase superfamily II)